MTTRDKNWIPSFSSLPHVSTLGFNSLARASQKHFFWTSEAFSASCELSLTKEILTQPGNQEVESHVVTFLLCPCTCYVMLSSPPCPLPPTTHRAFCASYTLCQGSKALCLTFCLPSPRFCFFFWVSHLGYTIRVSSPVVPLETLDTSLSCSDAESTREVDRAIVLKIE